MVCIVDKMAQDVARDGRKYCGVIPMHLVWLVFEGSNPTCACFHSENFFVTCSCCFFVSFVFQGKMHKSIKLCCS